MNANFPHPAPQPTPDKSSLPIVHRKPPRAAVMVPLPGTPAAWPKVSLKKVCLRYRTNGSAPLEALKNIDLEVRSGEFLCVVGPSGCGKSTLLHLIAGLERQTSGEITINNRAVQGTGTVPVAYGGAERWVRDADEGSSEARARIADS